MLSIIGGLVFLVVGLLGVIVWSGDLWIVLKGSLPLMAVLGGLVAVAAGISSVKDERAAKKEEEESKSEEKTDTNSE
ncbi:hypothetical protein KAI68_02150 [bacterium]|nr:hypothetical protein [bacterium]